MIMHGCQAKPKTPTIIEKTCPQCGHEIELFSIDTQMPCEHCGFVAYNDTLSCVQWCKHAKKMRWRRNVRANDANCKKPEREERKP